MLREEFSLNMFGMVPQGIGTLWWGNSQQDLCVAVVRQESIKSRGDSVKMNRARHKSERPSIMAAICWVLSGSVG